MRLPTRRSRRACCLLFALATAVACAEPPHKEIDQAQGAIDAARAAGAEQYAPAEYAAATQALTQASEAVTGRDYRLALNYALESREQAQNAARTAADTRVKLRGDVERSLAEVKALVTQAGALMKAPSTAQIPRRTRRSAQQTLTQAEKTLQEADAALQNEDYMKAEGMLDAARERIQGVIATLTGAQKSQSSRRRG